jgi:sulfite reductase (NADPH) flavoprotein alpha-component
MWRCDVREHPSFRIAGNRQRRLILIGNGTGLAGLVSHLQQRARQVLRTLLVVLWRAAACT